MKHDCRMGNFHCYQDREIDPLILRFYEMDEMVDDYELIRVCPFCAYYPKEKIGYDNNALS